ncbi:N-acetylglucosamine kinase [Microlunatus speluncae]|uniref:N-acetylglucosamine kinase n=1 Tax=Microlunatus speluncae TaxID=2594267 RepID=UPI0012665245|nr:BadF/BadG/BcrA/BcrD ATPase family protein [Microlunatus speluncae]
MTGVIIGADVGGTSTRVGVADLTGRFLAVAQGGPANPNAVGHEPAIAEIRRVTAEALSSAATAAGEPLAITGVVIGLAGITGLADPIGFGRSALPPIEPADPPLAVVTDLAVAYASATPDPDGYALIAGTGAFAGRISSGVQVERRDGWGWLLGDDGSGFWLGREAVRATLTQLEHGRPLSPLARAVLGGAVPDAEVPADALIRNSYARPPRELSHYAPLVTGLAGHDPVAAEIADRAAELLAGTLGALDPVPGRPVVLAGSVLLARSMKRPSPIGTRLRALLADRLDNPLFDAGPGVVGAAWLAVPGTAAADRERHARLLASVATWSG